MTAKKWVIFTAVVTAIISVISFAWFKISLM